MAANYRSSQRAKSRADFASKITPVLEEADETEFWLEFIARTELLPAARLAELRAKADELTRIFAAIRRSSRR
ncbi:four helix bundle protein [Oleiharenicola sp. Vm1]|uniref:four helix bundle protein n=1 Tax=Oleiharenicola sp. Vm1 TaxID=3398393 RepID=UPI0039F57A65